jgi:hypothetical protein
VNTDWFGGKAARVAAALLVASALAFGVAACGDDDDDDAGSAETTEATTSEESASAEEVTVTATEYDFALSATPTAETTKVTFDNQGKKFHAFVFGTINEGFTLDEAIQLEGRKGSAETLVETGAEPGKAVEAELKAPLEPGVEYVMLCPIQDKDGKHWELGQLQEFQIE